MIPRILIVYSNPPSSGRLRLDMEHRRVDLAIKRCGLDPSIVDRLHATSIDDLTNALRTRSYEIIQFSGHGSATAIYLENSIHNGSVRLSAEKCAQILLETGTRLRLAIFLSCYSAETVPTLIAGTPYLITVDGAADDEAAIAFIGEFYESFFQHDSINQAFVRAKLLVEAKGMDLNVFLSRRAEQTPDRIRLQVFPAPGLDSILVDVTEAEQDIRNLDIDRQTFYSLLTRKLRIHRWIFDSPTDQTILSIGRYFGVFSWQNARDVVNCQRVIRLRSDVDELTCETWAGLLTWYNDHRADKYRSSLTPAAPEMERHLKESLEDYHRLSDTYFRSKDMSRILRNCVREQYVVSRSLIVKYLEICDSKLHRGELSAVVEYLESILSSLHDLVDAFTQHVSAVE
jgi:CHAT domain